MKIGDSVGSKYQGAGIQQEDSVTSAIRQQINEAKKQRKQSGNSSKLLKA